MIIEWVFDSEERIGEAKSAPLLRKLVAAEPDRFDLMLRLVRVLAYLDRQKEILDLLGPVITRSGIPEEFFLHYGFAASRLGDFAAAIPALERAAANGDPLANGILADALYDSGDRDRALAIAQCTLASDPNEVRSLQTASKILLARGETRELLELCRDLHVQGAFNSEIAAMRAVAACAEGEGDVQEIVDAKFFARIEGAGDAAFNAALAEEILAHPALAQSVSYRATVGDGVRIEKLEATGGSKVQVLLARIRTHVQDYVRKLETLPPSFFTAVQPQRLVLTAWALVLRGDGHERAHVHPAAWLSGVYYVSVPEMADTRRGSIAFGPLRTPDGVDLEKFPRWEIAPRAGELLLFPSSFAHSTRPTETSAPRICVAFDICPA